MSYLDVAECIISTAQQANPKVMGQSEPLRAQFTNSSTFVTMNSTLFSGGACKKSSTDFVSWSEEAKNRVCVVRGAARRAGRMAARAGGAAARAARANAARSILLVSKVVRFNCRRGVGGGLFFRGETAGAADARDAGPETVTVEPYAAVLAQFFLCAMA